MRLCAPIYGYEITQPCTIGEFRLTPRTSQLSEAKRIARDKFSYHLTGYLESDEIAPRDIFLLEAILSFIEHLDVTIGTPVCLGREPIPGDFTESIKLHTRNSGGGAALWSDVMFGNSRAAFSNKCLVALRDNDFCQSTLFHILFHKKVEAFRQTKPFLEVTYFLLYSGLEAHARAVLGDSSKKNSSTPITTHLKNLGFDVSEERPDDLPRAISTYTHLRNALFHNSALECQVNMNGTQVLLRMEDYLFNIIQLVTLVVFKAVQFDDGHINWNSWIDRQPIK